MYTALLVLSAVAAPALAYDNGYGSKPIMGWATWSTDDLAGLRDVCTESEVLNVARFMASSGMRDLGYEWLMLDDCWAHTSRNETGHLMPDPHNFPSGMRQLAQAVHALGLRIGLYTCIGTSTCRGGRPGSFGNYKLDAETFADWEIDLVKCDRCAKPSGFSDQELYTNFSRELNATGRPMLFAICSWGRENVQEWGPGVAQMVRVQQDHLPFWRFPALAAGQGYGQGVIDVVNYMADFHPSRYFGKRVNAWPDADMLETLFPVTMQIADSRTEYTMWALWASPLLVATDVRQMDAVRKSLLMNPEVIAVNQDELGVPGERRAVYDNGAQVWSKPLANGDVAVALLNPNNFGALTITVTWDLIGFYRSAIVQVRDLWQRQDIGVYGEEGFEWVVGAHDVSLFRASIAHSADA